MNTNMKPADELLTIRKRIKELQAREKEISDGIKSGDLDDAGDFAIARLSPRKTTRFDKKAAEEELGDLSRFNVTGETVTLTLDELELAPEARA
jgi:hypothetical protein